MVKNAKSEPMPDPADALVQAEAAAAAVYFPALYALRGLDYPGVKSSVKESGAGEVNIRLSGIVGSIWGGIDTEGIIAELDRIQPKKINLKINSPGGYHAAALALYNDLIERQQAGVLLTARAQGIVASAAVKFLLAAPAGERTLANAEIMIHKPWSFLLTLGDDESILAKPLATARRLAVANETYYDIYAERLEMPRSEIKTWMGEGDKWFTTREAAAAGFGKMLPKVKAPKSKPKPTPAPAPAPKPTPAPESKENQELISTAQQLLKELA